MKQQKHGVRATIERTATRCNTECKCGEIHVKFYYENSDLSTTRRLCAQTFNSSLTALAQADKKVMDQSSVDIEDYVQDYINSRIKSDLKRQGVTSAKVSVSYTIDNEDGSTDQFNDTFTFKVKEVQK